MTDRRRTRAQVFAAAVAIALLLWSLLIRDDPEMTPFHAVVGWAMVAGLAGYIALALRGLRS